MIGIGGAILLGNRWTVLDPLASIVVSVFIVRAAWQLMMESMKELTEASLSDEDEAVIMHIAASEPGVSEVHNLRTRRVGNRIAIEMHARMLGSTPLVEAHLHATAIEHRLFTTLTTDSVYAKKYLPMKSRRQRGREREKTKQGYLAK